MRQAEKEYLEAIGAKVIPTSFRRKRKQGLVEWLLSTIDNLVTWLFLKTKRFKSYSSFLDDVVINHKQYKELSDLYLSADNKVEHLEQVVSDKNVEIEDLKLMLQAAEERFNKLQNKSASSEAIRRNTLKK